MIKDILAKTLDYSGILYLKRNLGNKNLIVLSYHKVAPVSDEVTPDTWSATPPEFEKQMIYLKKHYNLISAENFKKCFKAKKFEKNSILITFDDGLKENYTYVYPILKKYQIPAIFFITTGFIGSKKLSWWDELSLIISKTTKKHLHLRFGDFELTTKKDKKRALGCIINELKKYSSIVRARHIKNISTSLEVSLNKEKDSSFLSWDEIKKLHKVGIVIEPHTVSHPILSNESSSRIFDEISESKLIIEKKLGKTCRFFCYPNGGKEDINDAVLKALRKNKIGFAFTTIPGENSPSADNLKLKRICIDQNFSFSIFKAEVCGILNKIRWLKNEN